MPMRAARCSCATTMPLWARIGVAGRIGGACETGATWAEAIALPSSSAIVKENMRAKRFIMTMEGLSAVVPAKRTLASASRNP